MFPGFDVTPFRRAQLGPLTLSPDIAEVAEPVQAQYRFDLTVPVSRAARRVGYVPKAARFIELRDPGSHRTV